MGKTAKRLTGRHPLAYTGVEPVSPPKLVIESRAPKTTDIRNFNIGAIWVVKSKVLAKQIYMLVDEQDHSAQWAKLFPGGSGTDLTFETLTIPAYSENSIINVLGETNITVQGDLVNTDELHISLNPNVTLAGTLEAAGAITFTDLDEGVVQSDAAGLLSASKGTDGQVLISPDVGAPEWGDLTSDDASVTITSDTATPGAFVLDFSVEAGAGGFDGLIADDAATASPLANKVTVAGQTDFITTDADTANTISISLNPGGLGTNDNGKLLVGAAAENKWKSLLEGSNITLSENADSVTITAAGGGGAGELTAVTDSGSAVSDNSVLNILGSPGDLETHGSGNTVTLNSLTCRKFITDGISPYRDCLTSTVTPTNWIQVTGTKESIFYEGNLGTYAGDGVGNYRLHIHLKPRIFWKNTEDAQVRPQFGDPEGGLTGAIFKGYAGEALEDYNVWLHNWGTNNTWLGMNSGFGGRDSESNTAVGYNSMSDGSVTGAYNSAFGSAALANCTSGSTNCAFGRLSLNDLTTGSNNACYGEGSAQLITTGSGNTAIGEGSLDVILTASNNIAIGKDAGSLTNTSDNIMIGHDGLAGESNGMHIGTHGTGSGQVNKCYIAGINDNGLDGASKKLVFIDSDHEVGTGASFSAGYVTTDSNGVVSIVTGPTSPLPDQSPGVLRSDGTDMKWSNSAFNGRVLISGPDNVLSPEPLWRNLTAGDGINIINASHSITISQAQRPAFLYSQVGISNNRTGDGTIARLGNVDLLTKRYDNLNNCTTGGVFTAPTGGVYHLGMTVTFSELLDNVPLPPSYAGDPLYITTSNRKCAMIGLSFQFQTTPGNKQTFQYIIDVDMDQGDTAYFSAGVSLPTPDKIVDFFGYINSKEYTFIYGHLVTYNYA